MRTFKKNPLLIIFYHLGVTYPSPVNLNYFWNFGSLGLLFLVNQILSGLFLAMYYVPNIDLAFSSIEYIMHETNYGWLLRYLHLNGASLFFFVIYLHIARGLYFSSYLYPRQHLWITGVIIFVLMIATAFLGYVLPWGQMSFWAATVITNLFTAIPYVGYVLVEWLWGGFAVNNATLNRFYSLHFFFPFVIFFLVVIHVIFLHEHGSSNPLGIYIKQDTLFFHPYYTLKDLLGVFITFIGFFMFVFFMPEVLGHSDNYIKANPLVTPEHIVPEWYFLPFYAILRSVPDKLYGVILLINAIVCLYFMPFFVKNKIRATIFDNVYKYSIWFFFFNVLWLGYLGGCPVETPYYELAQLCTFIYFFYFSFLWILSLVDLFFIRKVNYKHKYYSAF